jgi:phosphoglycerate dehydrogenase-like enzyme
MLRLCRWGKADYEQCALRGLPEGVVQVDDPAAAEVVVVPSTRRVDPRDVPCARLVITTTSGYENLDVAGLRSVGVVCARLPLVRRDAVVETSLGMILALTRRFGEFGETARADRWDRAHLDRYDARLLGRVAVVGMGVIGRRMAEVLTAVGAEVVPVGRGDPWPTDVQVVTLHASLDRAEPLFVGAAAIDALLPGCVLVNTARGRLLDVEAAWRALERGHLGGLALDVFPEEPARLARFVHPRAIVTPHAAGWHPALGDRIAEGVSAAVRALLAGEPVPWAL